MDSALQDAELARQFERIPHKTRQSKDCFEDMYLDTEHLPRDAPIILLLIYRLRPGTVGLAFFLGIHPR